MDSREDGFTPADAAGEEAEEAPPGFLRGLGRLGGRILFSVADSRSCDIDIIFLEGFLWRGAKYFDSGPAFSIF